MKSQIDFFLSLIIFSFILLYTFTYPLSAIPSQPGSIRGQSELLLSDLRSGSPGPPGDLTIDRQKLLGLKEKPIGQLKEDLELKGKDIFIMVDFPSLKFTIGHRGDMDMITRYAVLEKEIGEGETRDWEIGEREIGEREIGRITLGAEK